MSIPLFYVGFTMLWVLMLVSFTNETFAIGLGLLSLLVCFAFYRNKTVLVVFAASFVACSLFVLKTEFYQKPALEFVGETVTIEGTIVSDEGLSDSGANRYVVKVTSGPLKGYKIRLSSKNFSGSIDDIVSFSAKVYSIDYLKHRDIFLGCYTYGDITSTESSTFSFRKLAFNIRSYLSTELGLMLPSDEASVLLGMLIGDKSKLSDSVYSSFQSAGVVHLLAVSGFHTSLWSMIIYRELLKRGLNLRVSAVVSILFIALFIGVTGFSKSTVRAGIMLMVFFVGRVLSRQPDSKNSLGLAAIVVLILNPFAGGDTGFLLSFFSTLGILTVYPALLKSIRPKIKTLVPNFYVRQRVESVISIILISISAFIFTLPLVMLLIGNVSLISPISNLLVTTVASASIFLSGVALILSKIPVLCAFENPLLLVCGLMVRYVIWASTFLSSLSFATTDVSVDFVKVAVAATVILVGFAVLLRAKPKRTAVLSSVFLILSVIAHYLVEYIETLN